MVSSNSTAAIKPHDTSAVKPHLPRLSGLWNRRMTLIAILAVSAIVLHVVLRFGWQLAPVWNRIPLLATLTLGGLSI